MTDYHGEVKKKSYNGSVDPEHHYGNFKNRLWILFRNSERFGRRLRIIA